MAGVFPAMVVAALRRSPNRTAIEMGTRSVTYGELLAIVRRLTAGMRRAGLGPGVSVGIVLSPSPEAYAAHLAAHCLGCVVAPIRPGWGARQRAEILDRLDFVVADEPVDREALVLEELLAGADSGDLPTLAQPDEIARLTYTSGSTGRPKACAHTSRAIGLAYRPDRWAPTLARLLSHFERCLIRESLASPVMFTYLGRCLVVGGTAVLPAGLAMEEVIDRYRVTATLMPPARLQQLLETDADLSSLQAVVLGGSPASPSLIRAATDRLGPIVWQGYGQGEAGVIAMLTPDDVVAGHEASVGRPLPAVRLAIRDGEIFVRSPHQMIGYWNDPEQTREVLSNGWIRTRDLGYLDEQGYLHLTGRARDVIMVNAEVCYAGAIERVLAEHPAVAQAYVVGAPDPETGEAVHAFVVPIGDQPPDVDELSGLVRRRLSRNSVPSSITVTRDVPMSASGKPDKSALIAGIR
jgi:acyl-CoA synthetase (AMP-forming)/AMP-acid ligase II